ncbi:MAG TPA: hypothetical protein VHZ98_03640 [Galbitalea sp.]|jgi:hypothetical protein|nr:hypothetical protein [Galbitalea sp.]
MSSDQPTEDGKETSRLLPGISARRWQKLHIYSYPIAVLGFIALFIFAAHSPQVIWYPILLLPLGFMGATWIGQAVRDRVESNAGYTSRSNWRINLDQVDAKTGAIVRAAGTPFPSSKKASSYVGDEERLEVEQMPFEPTPIARAREIRDDVIHTAPHLLSPSPSGEGVVLTSRPSASTQIAITALLGLGISAFVTIDVGLHFGRVNVGGYVITFVASVGGCALLWLALLGGRTLERRRLLKRFPGTLVFSFARSADISAGLRRLGLIDPINDFDIGTVQAVVDLRGITLWQGNPPTSFASIPWTLVRAIRVEHAFAPNASRSSAIVNIEISSEGGVTQLPLFCVNASILPFPHSGETGWVERQLQGLLAKSSSAA